MRPTWAEVSLSALRHNFRLIKQHVGAAVTVCAVIKADAYGHGAPESARALQDAGATWFGVTSTEEGIKIRDAGVTGRILLMTGFWRGEQEDVVSHNLTPTVWEWWQIGALESELSKINAPPRSFPVHVKVDTGMARLGVPDYYMGLFLKRIKAAEPIALEGVFSHLASAEVLDAEDAKQQANRFAEFEQCISEYGFSPQFRHIANSAAVTGRPSLWRNMVRPGMLLYGYGLPLMRTEDDPEIPNVLPVRRVLSWKTKIISMKDVGAGQTVGYKAAYVTNRPTKLAVLPVGYADGLSRHLSSRGRVIVRGNYVPMVGIISMDITVVDVTDVGGAALGDEVTIIGSDGDCMIDAWEHARLEATIPYEVLCRVGGRVRRTYTE
jgi:alanine racemase